MTAQAERLPPLYRITFNQQERLYWVGDLLLYVRRGPEAWIIESYGPSAGEPSRWVRRNGLAGAVFARRRDAVRAVMAADGIDPAPRHQVPERARLIRVGAGEARSRDGHFTATWVTTGWTAHWEVTSKGRYSQVGNSRTLTMAERRIGRHIIDRGADA